MFQSPSWSDPNAIWRPSGDHVGHQSLVSVASAVGATVGVRVGSLCRVGVDTIVGACHTCMTRGAGMTCPGRVGVAAAVGAAVGVGGGSGVSVGATSVSTAATIACNSASLGGGEPPVSGGALAAGRSNELIPPKAKSHIAMAAMPSAASRMAITQ